MDLSPFVSQRRDFAYDSDGRRTQEYWCPAGSGPASGCGTSTPTRIFTYTYDAANQLTEVNEPDSRYTFTYDNDGRVTGTSSLGTNMPQVTLTNVYDSKGRRTSVSDNLSPAGSITFTYDARDRVTQLDWSFGPTVTLSYDAADRLTGLTRKASSAAFDNTRTSFTYDNADRMTAITHTYNPSMGQPTTLATYTYSYDAASQLTVETNQDGLLTYTYDNDTQLTGVDGSGGTCGPTGCDESFSYDVNGNRTMTGYSTGTGNRLTSDGTYNYTFDDNGNTLTKTRISDSQKWEFTWDYRNRLTQVLLKDSSNNILQQSDYTYDAFNRRIIKSFDDDGPGSHAATVTKTIYDGADFAANPYADFDGNNSLTIRYLYGPAVDFILARRNASGTIAWYLADHLGTIRDIANTSGTVLDHVSYSAFGKVTAETNPSNGDRVKYTGREYDSDLGAYYYRARFYDPALGRFEDEDPLSYGAGDANIFRYVGNRTTLYTDPSGRRAFGVGSEIISSGALIPGRPLPYHPLSLPGAQLSNGIIEMPPASFQAAYSSTLSWVIPRAWVRLFPVGCKGVCMMTGGWVNDPIGNPAAVCFSDPVEARECYDLLDSAGVDVQLFAYQFNPTDPAVDYSNLHYDHIDPLDLYEHTVNFNNGEFNYPTFVPEVPEYSWVWANHQWLDPKKNIPGSERLRLGENPPIDSYGVTIYFLAPRGDFKPFR